MIDHAKDFQPTNAIRGLDQFLSMLKGYGVTTAPRQRAFLILARDAEISSRELARKVGFTAAASRDAIKVMTSAGLAESYKVGYERWTKITKLGVNEALKFGLLKAREEYQNQPAA